MAPKRKSTSGGSSKPTKSTKTGALRNVSEITAEVILSDDTSTTLSDLVKLSGAIFFMYPRANTPGCTKQACGFRDNYSELKKLGFEVFGLSYDKPKSQTNWINKYELQYKCITDTDGAVIKAFGASKAAKSILRSHVVVAKGGDIIDIQNGISPGDSFTTALETAKEAAKKS